jgi:two-component system, chemotaxis family, CheB/CheR fusion protein
MLQTLREDTGMGFVFVQHLDPKHVSILTELLQRQTKMRVEEAGEGMPVEPNHIYVIPRDRHMGMKRGVLTLSPRVDSPLPHMPIDPFLRSLAADRKSKAIGVVLSGNAFDGALGMMAIKAAVGITFAQSSESAKHDGMPRAAAAFGCIDFVLSPREIAKELARLGEHPYISPAPRKGDKEPAAGTWESIRRILELLHNATGVDFTYYKADIIRRRILRRIALRRVEALDDYIARLGSDPAEQQALYDDILINVTEFFRDPEIFEQLKKLVFPKIAPRGHNATGIRIWVPAHQSHQFEPGHSAAGPRGGGGNRDVDAEGLRGKGSERAVLFAPDSSLLDRGRQSGWRGHCDGGSRSGTPEHGVGGRACDDGRGFSGGRRPEVERGIACVRRRIVDGLGKRAARPGARTS